MDMRIVHLIDLIKKGYLWPETSVMRAWWYGFGEGDPLEELLLIAELLVSRN